MDTENALVKAINELTIQIRSLRESNLDILKTTRETAKMLTRLDDESIPHAIPIN